MKSLHILIIFLVVLTSIIIFHSCRKEEIKEMKVETTAINQVMSTSVIAGGSIISLGEGAEQYGHCWSLYPTPSADSSINDYKNEKGPPSTTGEFSSEITGLEPGTSYHLRAYMKRGKEIVYGKEMTFTTLDGRASLTTFEVHQITITSATSGGNISSVNGDQVLLRGVCWDTMKTVDLKSNSGFTSDGSGIGSFTSEISGLTPGITYFIKAYAISSVDTSYAVARKFTTLDGKPSVTTMAVTNVDNTERTASCGGNVTSDGGFPVNARGLCWSANPDPDIADSVTINGSGEGSFTDVLSGLTGRTYYVRAYATNIMGTSYGDQTIIYLPVHTVVVDVTNPVTGKTWMDRNLGAIRAATSFNDSLAYGDMYQWGRAADGHQLRTSGITTIWSNSDTPGHDKFISPPPRFHDWRIAPNNSLWQGAGGINCPCPRGYRLPTDSEWEAERNSWSSNNSAGAFNSPLKLPAAGLRSVGFILVGSRGWYWSSTVDGNDDAKILDFGSSHAQSSSEHRWVGISVRCIKD